MKLRETLFLWCTTVLLGVGVDRVYGMTCTDEVSPSHLPSSIESQSQLWGFQIAVPNPLTLLVTPNQYYWNPPSSNEIGGVWVYRRPRELTEFEQVQTIGNDTFGAEYVVSSFGAADDDLAVIQTGDGAVYYNITMYRFDSLLGIYEPFQILAVPSGATAYPGPNHLAMCSNWLFSVWYAEGTESGNFTLYAFRKPTRAGPWVPHSILRTSTTAQFVTGVSADCSRFATAVSSRLYVYQFDPTANSWEEIQSFSVAASTGSVAPTATRLFVGDPVAAYDGLAQAGRVSEYKWNGTHYDLAQLQLPQPGARAGSWCGYVSQVQNDTILRGCPRYYYEGLCDPFTPVCQTQVCSETGRNLSICGRADQYSLNATTGLYSFVTARRVLNTDTVPCASNGLHYGTSVVYASSEAFVSSPGNITAGRVYTYSDAPACISCPCLTNDPCLNGGICEYRNVTPFFNCSCPSNFTGDYCQTPVTPVVPPTPSSDTQPSTVGVQVAIYLFAGVVVVAAVVLLGWSASAGSSSPTKGPYQQIRSNRR